MMKKHRWSMARQRGCGVTGTTLGAPMPRMHCSADGLHGKRLSAAENGMNAASGGTQTLSVPPRTWSLPSVSWSLPSVLFTCSVQLLITSFCSGVGPWVSVQWPVLVWCRCASEWCRLLSD